MKKMKMYMVINNCVFRFYLPIINFDYYVQLKVKTTNNDKTRGKQIPITLLINIVMHLQPQTTYLQY